MPLKILVISNYRTTVTVRPEAEIFIGLQKAGHSVTIMTYGDSAYCANFKEAGIRLIDFHPQKKFDKKEIAFIHKEIKDGDYDVMHLFNGVSMINGIQAAKKTSVKVVLYRGFEGHIHWYDPAAYFKFLHPRVDAILCNSEGVAEHIRKASVFIKPQLVTVNKGHRLEWYQEVEALNPAALDLDPNAFYAVCAANNRRMKGVPYLLQSFAHIPADANIQLLLLGKDMQTPGNLKIIAGLPRPERIHFLGWRGDSLRIVKMAQTFVLSSLYGESITKSVLEGMSLATPAVITNIPGNREMIEDGVSGYVVPKMNPKAMAEALLKMYADKDAPSRMGAAAKERIRTRFSSEVSIKGYGEFYTKLAAQE
jgi:glycosyltransferase involved in cell wall biosynthesis